jgi:flagellar hook-length control protein FliK
LIVLPPMTAPTPTGGAKAGASDKDGTDAGLSDVFASLVGALLNPALATATPIVDGSAPTAATPAAAIATTSSISSISAATTALSASAGSAGFAGKSADTGATPLDLTATAPAEAAAAPPVLSTAAAAIAQAANAGGTVTIDAPTAIATVTPTALPAATVLQARQSAQEPVVVENKPSAETANTAAASKSSASATPAAIAAAEEDDDVDTEAVSNHIAVEMPDQQGHALGHVAPTGKTHVTAPTSAVEPHQQIAAVVSPLRRRGDGSYQLTLHIKPEHLGNVDLHVDLHHGTVDLHMHTDNQQAHDAILDHLDDLKSELERAGLKAGQFDVGTGDNRQQPQANTGTTRPTFAPVQPIPEAEVAVPTQAIADDSTVDVRA